MKVVATFLAEIVCSFHLKVENNGHHHAWQKNLKLNNFVHLNL